MKTNLAPRILAISTAAIALTVWLASQRPATAAFSSGGAQPPIGKECVIQFRRGDALGAAGNLPINPTTSSINGAETTVSGTLRTISPEWLSLETPQQTTLWIPKGSILLIQTQR